MAVVKRIGEGLQWFEPRGVLLIGRRQKVADGGIIALLQPVPLWIIRAIIVGNRVADVQGWLCFHKLIGTITEILRWVSSPS